jgi:Glycosyltransferase family 87
VPVTRANGRALHPALALVPGVAVLLAAAAAVKSIPFYHGWIVLTYTCACLLLGVAVVRGWRVGVPGRKVGGLVVGAAGVVQYLVPTFTYLPDDDARAVRALVAVAALAAGAAVALRRPAVGLGLAATAFVAGSAAVIHLDPGPHIDVWYSLQGAADAVLHGRNMYTEVWPDSPGVKDAFTYLPLTAVLLAPAKLLTGDVRWGLVVAELAAAAVVVALARTNREQGDRTESGLVAACVLLLLPGTLTQVEQAWTEPLVLLLVAGALLAVDRGRLGAAVVLFALALASKQHIALLLPLLAVWRPFGPRRTLAVTAGAALLVLPWAVRDLPAMWHDTVTLLVGFHPIRFADTLYLAAIHELGWTPPFWLTGALVVAVVGLAAVVVHRGRPSPARFAAVAALALFGANLLNKQAFYNQFWLVGALVLLAWSADPARAPAADVNARTTTADGLASAATIPTSRAGSR